MSSKAVESDPNKVEAIVDWPTLTTLNEARSFHGLATLIADYPKFQHIMAPTTDCTKKVNSFGHGQLLKSLRRLRSK